MSEQSNYSPNRNHEVYSITVGGDIAGKTDVRSKDLLLYKSVVSASSDGSYNLDTLAPSGGIFANTDSPTKKSFELTNEIFKKTQNTL